MDPAGVLRAYAQLSADPPPPPKDVLAKGDPWAPYPFFAERIFDGGTYEIQRVFAAVDKYKPVQRVLAAGALEGGARQLRIGWLWFAGTLEIEGETQRFCFPALSVPVERGSYWFGTRKGLAAVGDIEVTPLVTNEAVRDWLFESREFGGGALIEQAQFSPVGEVYYNPVDPRILPRLGRLQSWVGDVAQGVGLEIDDIGLQDDMAVAQRRRKPGIGVVVTHGLYLDGGAAQNSTQETLRRFSGERGLESTAFAKLFGAEPEQLNHKYVHQVRPFSARQEQALHRLGSSSLSLLSGPPGTGKTHLLVAAATDAVAWGKSVLVVSGSKHASNVLINYFMETPGPTPVVFDGSVRAKELGFKLAEQASETPSNVTDSERVIERHATLESAFLIEFERLVTRAASNGSSGSMGLKPLLDEIWDHEGSLADAFGEAFTALWLSPLGPRERTLLREIGYSLSSTRSERIESFTDADPERLTGVAPLWVGTLEDVERILPAVPGMFDLVILDEAAHTNPIDAAGSLVRAKSALICGDPTQLGHSSFLPTSEVELAAADHGVDAVAINPRKNSLYDVAAARVPATVIDEHYRSAPHLIEFSSRRFYNSELQVVTRHPKNDAADHIDVHLVEGERGNAKVNLAEVDRCLSLIDEYAEQGWTSIGLVSPFRAQADKLEAAVLAKYSLADIDRLGLRVGTVHGFQGDERDVMIASWAVGPEEPDKAWQFVNQPNLFNVMVTRAREQMAIVTSVATPPGLAGEYVKWSEPLVDIVANIGASSPWVQKVAAQLEDASVPVRIGYRVGHHLVDIVAGSGEHAIAIDCVPHADGAEAHLDRGLQLRRMGWQTEDAYELQWRDELASFVVELLTSHPDLRT